MVGGTDYDGVVDLEVRLNGVPCLTNIVNDGSYPCEGFSIFEVEIARPSDGTTLFGLEKLILTPDVDLTQYFSQQ